MGTSGYGSGSTVLATTTTDANGNFIFTSGSYTCPFANTPVYLTAKGGNSGFANNPNIMMAAGIGPCSGAAAVTLNLNEVTTAATAFALSHFFTTGFGATSTDSFGGTSAGNGVYNTGMVMANTYTIPSIVAIASGTALPSAGTVTREDAKLNTVANIIAACVNSAGGTAGQNNSCGTLFQATTTPGLISPTDTLQADVAIALSPYQNVATLYNLPGATSPFIGLSTQPNDFTIGISYTSTTLGLGINGTGYSGAGTNIDIDATGRVWFPTNTATAHGVADFDPTTSTFNGPYETALIHPQYVAVDTAGNIFGTDLASNTVAGVPTASPTATATSTHFLPTGSIVGPIAATATASVPDALIYASTTSGGSSALWVEANGNQGYAIPYTNAPTGIAAYYSNNPDGDYEAESATSGASTACLFEDPYTYGGSNYPGTVTTTSGGACVSGGAAQLDETGNESVIVATTLNQLCDYNSQQCFTPNTPVNLPVGVAVDGLSNIWLANSGNASVSTILYQSGTNSPADYKVSSPIAYIHNATFGNTLTTPYGIAIDRSGNVWVSNASCVGINCAATSFTLSELIGAGAPTVTPLVSSILNTINATRPTNVIAPHAQAVSPLVRHHQQ